jgi:hypothetical protein
VEKKSFITVVSGLPRSGTSMMMSMLEAGGMSLLTDALRIADENNPKGYYEFERVKKLREGDTAWVSQAEGKVVKVISFLLKDLPTGYDYKIIFMQRKMEEILASQNKMLRVRGEETDAGADPALSLTFEKHLIQIREWLKNQARMSVYYVRYNDLLANPHSHLQDLQEFLDIPLQQEKMLQIIDGNLYRNRS